MLEFNKIYNQSCIDGMKQIPDESIDIVLCDPPYNIGKDFGNESDRQELKQYLEWCDLWLKEAVRIVKPSGTIYIYGFSEILAHISVRLDLNQRWLIWHYTNKNNPHSKFWQRSHESIIVAWKQKPLFNLDNVREPYTETFLKNAAGKIRKGTSGRFTRNGQETVYAAHEKGALPRDVVKVPALSGGAGANERWFFCTHCSEAFPNKEKNNHIAHGELIQHPTQKPFNITEKLLLAAMPEINGSVVVPFVGSGSELHVIQKLNMSFIGFELNPLYVKLAESFLTKFQTHQ